MTPVSVFLPRAFFRPCGIQCQKPAPPSSCVAMVGQLELDRLKTSLMGLAELTTFLWAYFNAGIELHHEAMPREKSGNRESLPPFEARASASINPLTFNRPSRFSSGTKAILEDQFRGVAGRVGPALFSFSAWTKARCTLFDQECCHAHDYVFLSVCHGDNDRANRPWLPLVIKGLGAVQHPPAHRGETAVVPHTPPASEPAPGFGEPPNCPATDPMPSRLDPPFSVAYIGYPARKIWFVQSEFMRGHNDGLPSHLRVTVSPRWPKNILHIAHNRCPPKFPGERSRPNMPISP